MYWFIKPDRLAGWHSALSACMCTRGLMFKSAFIRCYVSAVHVPFTVNNQPVVSTAHCLWM